MTARDPAMLTNVHADRSDNDAYWTEPAATVALWRTLQRFMGLGGIAPLPHRIWEPAAGANWIAAELEALGCDVFPSDIADYSEAPTFKKVKRKVRSIDFLRTLEGREHQPPAGDWPFAIVTNPPFDADAEAFLRVALRQRRCHVVWMLLKNEYDCSGSERPDLFDDPRYFVKIVLRWRLAWHTPQGPIVSPRTGEAESGRHNYAWYGWNLVGRAKWPGARILYADRPADRAAVLPKVPATPPARHWQDRED